MNGDKNSKGRFAHVWSSPLSLVVLLLITSALAASWYEAAAGERAPAIAGYDWGQHRNALLLIAPSGDGCSSCGLSLSDWAKEGIKRRLDVVVLAARSSNELKLLNNLKKSDAQGQLSIVAGGNESVIQQFSPGGKMAIVRVQNGRVVSQAQSGASPQKFLVKE